jgi:hypothetical protein
MGSESTAGVAASAPTAAEATTARAPDGAATAARAPDARALDGAAGVIPGDVSGAGVAGAA